MLFFAYIFAQKNTAKGVFGYIFNLVNLVVNLFYIVKFSKSLVE